MRRKKGELRKKVRRNELEKKTEIIKKINPKKQR